MSKLYIFLSLAVFIKKLFLHSLHSLSSSPCRAMSVKARGIFGVSASDIAFNEKKKVFSRINFSFKQCSRLSGGWRLNLKLFYVGALNGPKREAKDRQSHLVVMCNTFSRCRMQFNSIFVDHHHHLTPASFFFCRHRSYERWEIDWVENNWFSVVGNFN